VWALSRRIGRARSFAEGIRDASGANPSVLGAPAARPFSGYYRHPSPRRPETFDDGASKPPHPSRAPWNHRRCPRGRVSVQRKKDHMVGTKSNGRKLQHHRRFNRHPPNPQSCAENLPTTDAAEFRIVLVRRNHLGRGADLVDASTVPPTLARAFTDNRVERRARPGSGRPRSCRPPRPQGRRPNSLKEYYLRGRSTSSCRSTTTGPLRHPFRSAKLFCSARNQHLLSSGRGATNRL